MQVFSVIVVNIGVQKALVDQKEEAKNQAQVEPDLLLQIPLIVIYQHSDAGFETGYAICLLFVLQNYYFLAGKISR